MVSGEMSILDITSNAIIAIHMGIPTYGLQGSIVCLEGGDGSLGLGAHGLDALVRSIHQHTPFVPLLHGPAVLRLHQTQLIGQWIS